MPLNALNKQTKKRMRPNVENKMQVTFCQIHSSHLVEECFFFFCQNLEGDSAFESRRHQRRELFLTAENPKLLKINECINRGKSPSNRLDHLKNQLTHSCRAQRLPSFTPPPAALLPTDLCPLTLDTLTMEPRVWTRWGTHSWVRWNTDLRRDGGATVTFSHTLLVSAEVTTFSEACSAERR